MGITGPRDYRTTDPLTTAKSDIRCRISHVDPSPIFELLTASSGRGLVRSPELLLIESEKLEEEK